ncbi:hypothetical protein GYMLUDRAFT_47603 [Collybiopsis luxurians FD-317 M1]|uniref:Unplaced genomic scaffold GYMLUscaffold_56, whole genome shotgun sequence n=1 Tax=Collybiopsis luxurians FD-317 M1 TaxID=944289 RepID=A0A0D0BLI7_9AGAR|nr:hypothetical protein GYMLUDRAFT_47603 [Collybiopsis luxurians FD-317 M1]
MANPEYHHTAFGFEGPLQSPALRKLAIKHTPLLLHHRLPSASDAESPVQPYSN